MLQYDERLRFFVIAIYETAAHPNRNVCLVATTPNKPEREASTQFCHLIRFIFQICRHFIDFISITYFT